MQEGEKGLHVPFLCMSGTALALPCTPQTIADQHPHWAVNKQTNKINHLSVSFRCTEQWENQWKIRHKQTRKLIDKQRPNRQADKTGRKIGEWREILTSGSSARLPSITANRLSWLRTYRVIPNAHILHIVAKLGKAADPLFLAGTQSFPQQTVWCVLSETVATAQRTACTEEFQVKQYWAGSQGS